MRNIDFNKKHLSPHRRNMIELFVNCTRKIKNEEGEKAITIKKISECTELNSATIYNYFENVEHLVFFANMDALDSFNADLKNYVTEGDDPLKVYIEVWKCFAKHAFNKPEEYYYIFFSEFAKEKPYYIYQYYKIFPVENNGFPAYLMKMLTTDNFIERLDKQIAVSINVGYFTDYTAEKVNDMARYIFEGLLEDIRKEEISKEEALEKFEEYLNIIVDTLKKK